jgi:hypothetical protein
VNLKGTAYRPAILVLLYSLFAAPFALAESEKGDELANAARNYEAAALARSETGETMLTIAREIRKKQPGTEKERLANLKTAGTYERQAGDLFLAACKSLDKATGAWSRALANYGKDASVSKSEELASAVKGSREAARDTCKRSAEAYEYSAEAFSQIDPGQMAISCEKAAEMREDLAARIQQ